MIVSSLKNLPKGPGLGRSNVKPVADKRKVQLQMFLDSLFKLAPEVSHSTLVYTFFHPLLRDEEVDEDSDSALSPSKGNLIMIFVYYLCKLNFHFAIFRDLHLLFGFSNIVQELSRPRTEFTEK